MHKFKNPGITILKSVAGSYYTAHDFMLLPLKLLFVLSDSGPACKKYGIRPIVYVSVLHVLSDSSDITCSGEVNAAAVSCVHTLDAMLSRKNVDCWTYPPGLSPMQLLPPHSIHFVSS